ncbi:CPBP family intramembrane glutamic endopeptidase [Rugosimonospora africana]|uniref:CAAX amino protease n=1 Tax=Rugosimonospora africana TaxID=556532 RepID=A0A8J3VUN8_9ACTN|nr:CPBP family intramembrane glutamic endopeptidase [Rugosimonospora africana]GIH19782.1 CAAX amino protease [Rugosimonospora africana]
MSVEPTEIPTTVPAAATRSGPPRWLRPIGVRLVFLLVVFAVVDVVFAQVNSLAVKNPVTGLLAGLATAAIALVGYARLVGWLEQRKVPEVGTATLRPQLARGVGLGIVLFAGTILLIFICDGYRVRGWGSVGDAIATFGLMAGVATCEELLFRGVLFRIVEEWAGTLVALVVSGLLFGVMHLLNPGGTGWGALSIAVEAGLMLGAAYVATRSLWLPIGLHLGWNFAESGIFGSTVSGSNGTVGGLLDGASHGPAIISGGAFGPEASILAVLIGGATAILLLRKARKAGRIVRAPWR